MANENFGRTPGKGKFAYLGVDLRNPPDLMPQGRAPYLLNVSPDLLQGAMSPRAGMANIGSVTGVPHSVKRVNNFLPGANPSWQRFIGAGGSLYTGQTSFNAVDSGFSGNPLSLIPYRPPQSPETWLYAFDSAKQAKYRTDGVTKQNVGILSPTIAPTATLYQPVLRLLLDATVSATGWTNPSGTTPTVATLSAASTTVGQILYDAGNPGWATIQPTNTAGNYAFLGPGLRINIGTESTTVQQVFGSSNANTTINGISYDSGTSGLGTISPLIAWQGLQRNMLILVNGTPVRVLSVTEGPDGLYSFRAVFPAGLAIGQTLAIPMSFRSYTVNAHAAGEAITAQGISATITAATATTTSLAATVSNPSLGPFDLTQIGGRPITDEDYMHVTFSVDNPANLQEVHFLLDVDTTTNDFNHNYYYYVVRQSDFQNVSTGTSTTITSQLNALQNDIANSYAVNNEQPTGKQLPYPAGNIGEFGSPNTNQLAVGASQLFQGVWKINDLTRVGTDMSVNLSNVKAIGVMLVLTANVTVQIGSWWAGGTFGPDVNFNSYGNQGQPIIYRYRYRSSLTGAYSDVSPATRNGELPWRQAISVAVAASADPQVDLIDIERNGGTGDTWHRFLSAPNISTAYVDSFEEGIVQAANPLELLSYAPWPVTDKPRYGTCNVVGTRVTWVSGDVFNLNWIRGVEIIINNLTYTLFAPPASTTALETAENIGVLVNVAFIIPEATIAGFPLPYVCLGPDGRFFATGDPYNPGFLYFSNPYNPDTVSDQGYIEVTGPSEPLGPPVFFEGAIYVMSIAGFLYRVEPTPGQANPYGALKLGGAAGLGATWGITADGGMLAWVGTDGIYSYGGQGGSANLTQAELYPLFPFESRPGLPVSVNGYTIYPPNYNQPARMRLSAPNGFLLFDYLDTQGNSCTLAFNMATRGWIPYRYSPGVTLHYEEQGVSNPLTLALGVDGSVNYLSSALTDNGAAFSCVVVTPADDQGDTRARKQYGDLMLDYAGQPNVTVYYDNYLVSSISPVLAGFGTRGQAFVDLGLDAVSLHRNIDLAINWSSTSGTVLYEWQPSYLTKPEDTVDRPTDWMDCGAGMHFKFIHGCRITADTGGVSRQVQIQYDGGLIGPVLTVNHAGELVLPYSFPPFKAHLVRLVPLGTATWRLMNVEWEVDLEPEATGFWVTQPTSFDLPGYLHIRDFQLAYACVNAGAVLTAVVDGVSYTLAGSLPATGGAEIKKYFPAPPIKGKIWQLYGTGTALQIYQRDCEFRVKPWAGGNYAVLKPFGDSSFTSGSAKI